MSNNFPKKCMYPCSYMGIWPYLHKLRILGVHSEMSIYNSTNKKLYFIHSNLYFIIQLNVPLK